MIETIWRFSMKCCHLLCHQKPDRSFIIFGYQFPLCARCTGVTVGFAIALLCLINKSFISNILAAALLVVMFADWLLQYAKVKESTNIRRLVTGILGGFGLSMLSYNVIVLFHDKIV